MRGEVRRAAVERQRAPPSAESRDAAVAVLQAEEPRDSSGPSGGSGAIEDAEFQQREERAGGVVGVGDSAGQVRPRPAAGRGVGVGMHARPLLAEQPFAEGEALLGLQRAGRERLDGEGARPRREVGVNRPAPIGSHAGAEKCDALLRDDIFAQSARGESHRDERRERRGFEEPAVARLERGEHSQRLLFGESAERIPRRRVVMNRLPNSDERRQRVADDGELDRAPEPVRDRRQLERELRNHAPIHAARDGEGHQDRDGKSAVLAVARGDSLWERRHVAEIGGGALVARRGPAERGGGEV